MADKQMTTLEEKFRKLEELTQSLESGTLSIDDAIAVYSQGMELAVDCKKSLDELSQKIEFAKNNAQQALNKSQAEDKAGAVNKGDLSF